MIDILLATYNGEKYLADQIDSIIKQTNKNWKLIIHDDGSTDNTIKIIKNYQNKFPEQIVFIEDGIYFRNCARNFMHLLKKSSSEYIMFCDQDDVWIPEKITLSFNKMKELEIAYGADTPLLVHTDLIVVDEKLDIIAESMWKSQRLYLDAVKNPCLLLVHNVVTGNTIIMNSIARNVSKDMPEDFPVHDWWVAIKVSESGIIEHLAKKTIFYRQHATNLIGTKTVFSDSIKLLIISYFRHLRNNLIDIIKRRKYSNVKCSIYKLLALYVLTGYKRLFTIHNNPK